VSGTVVVKIKRLAGSEDVPLPARQTEHSAGFDLCAAVGSPLEILPGEIALIPCGFAMAIPEGYEAQVRPRSGLASKHGVTLPNSPGTIDADYRGEVKVPLINHGKVAFTVTRGMRVAQMVVAPVPAVRLEVAEELPESGRGAGGFGSTGMGSGGLGSVGLGAPTLGAGGLGAPGSGSGSGG
jgi:dUTP pyrophosphatase